MKWLDKFSPNAALMNFPSTNARIFITLLGFIATGNVYLYLLAVGADSAMNESVFAMWLTFLSIWAGVDVYQWREKRKTYMSKSDDEDTG